MNAEASGAHVLVVEDDSKIAGVLRDYLVAAGHKVELFADGSLALAAIECAPPDLLILDVMLPGRDGVSVARAVRAFSPVPILMLTAKVAEEARIQGLEAGADDYVCKPFGPREVVARVAALLRRSEGMLVSAPPQEQLVTVDRAGRRIAWRGEWLPLSPAEFTVLEAFVRNPGRVFDRDQLLDRLGERSHESSDRAIDSHVKNIRKKIAAVETDAKPIKSVYGVGYRFEP